MTKPKILQLLLIGVGITMAINCIFFFSILRGIWQKSQSASTSPVATPNQIKIAASLPTIADLAKQVGGEHIQVVTILKPGANPHTFEPTPAEAKDISQAQIVFTIGHGIDHWAVNLVGGNQNTKVVQLDRNVPLFTDAYADADDRQLSGFDGQDPHYWLAPSNAVIMTQTIADELAQLDPLHRSDYQNNAAIYQAKLQSLDTDLRTQLAPFSERNLATFHNAFSYFARAYHLRIVAVFEEFSGKEPSPSFVAKFIDTMKKDQIHVIFTEPQSSAITLEPIAKDLQVKMAQLDDIGGVPGRDSYIELLQFNTQVIIKALQ
jgi:ABC-type Zn uptake system ZnuABC Zn-binding protein ZnuA